jgi:hypothetical protein
MRICGYGTIEGVYAMLWCFREYRYRNDGEAEDLRRRSGSAFCRWVMANLHISASIVRSLQCSDSHQSL